MDRLKTHASKGIWVAWLLLALPLLVIACGGDDDPSSQQTGDLAAAEIGAYGSTLDASQSGIWVNGSGQVTTVPDVATIRGGVNVTRETVSEAHREAAQQMNALMRALADRGIAERDIQTTRFNIYPQYQYDRETDESELVGYTVSNEISVTVRDLEQVGALIDDMVSAGGDDTVFSGVSFSVSDAKPLEEEARKLAVEDLIDKATQLADSAGVTLGDLVYINESSRGSPRTFAAEAMADSAAAPISAGEFNVVVWVQGVFEIE